MNVWTDRHASGLHILQNARHVLQNTQHSVVHCYVKSPCYMYIAVSNTRTVNVFMDNLFLFVLKVT